MNTRLYPLALLLPLALARPAPADTYTWAGPDGNFSNPASWAGPTPAIGGSAADQLIVPSSGPSTITLDNVAPQMLNHLSIAGPPQNFQYAPANIITTKVSAGLKFAGPNPQIDLTIGSYLQIDAPVAFDSTLTLNCTTYARVLISGPLAPSPTNAALNLNGGFFFIYRNPSQPAFSGGTFLNTQFVEWHYQGSSPPASLSFGSGPIAFSNGSVFDFLISSATTSSTVAFTNPIIVTQSGGVFLAQHSLPSATIELSGAIHLGGSLAVGQQQGPYLHDPDIWATYSNVVRLTGPISLEYDPTSFTQPGIGTMGFVEIAGEITGSAPFPYSAPFFLAGNLFISGSHNTYSTGTVINGYDGVVTVAPNSSLGSGPIYIQDGGTLRLMSLSNLTSGQLITLSPSAILCLVADDPDILKHLIPALGQISCGILSIETTFTHLLDLTSFTGMTSLSTGTYVASTLGVAADHVYRLDANHDSRSGNLTILNGVLTDSGATPNSASLGNVTLLGSNSYSGGSTVIANTHAEAPNALGTGDVHVIRQDNVFWVGALYIHVPNAVSPSATITVDSILALVGPNGALPNQLKPPVLNPGSTLQIGDQDSSNSDRYGNALPLDLHSSSLVMASHSSIRETIGTLSVHGSSTITFSSSSDAVMPALEPQAFIRVDHAVLFLSSTSSTGTIPLVTPQALAPAGSLTPPWLQYAAVYDRATWNQVTTPSFLIAAPNSFVPAAYQALPINGGSGTEVVDVSSSQTLAPDTSIAVLRIQKQVTLSNPGTPTTMRLTAGGLIVNTIYNSATIQPTLDFADAEAVVNVVAPHAQSWQAAVCSGGFIARNGLTKMGLGELVLPSNASITGPITLLQGSLTFGNPIPQNSPLALYGGTYLKLPETGPVKNAIQLHAGLPGDNYGAIEIFYPDNATLRFDTPITGDAGIYFHSQGTLQFAEPVHLTSSNAWLFSPYGPVIIDSSVFVGGNTYLYKGLRGTGTLHLTGNAILSTIHPGDSSNSPGTFTLISDDSSGPSLGTLIIDLFSDGQSDQLIYSGNSMSICWSTLELNAPGDLPSQPYLILSSSSYSGQFGTVTGLPDGFTLDYSPDGILLLPTGGTSIPEPTSLALLLPALLLLRKRPAPDSLRPASPTPLLRLPV